VRQRIALTPSGKCSAWPKPLDGDRLRRARGATRGAVIATRAGVNAITLASAVLILTVVLAGCATMTPEERAAIEEQERRRAVECERRGGSYLSGSSCVSRSGGA
jgi:hypothetical protein